MSFRTVPSSLRLSMRHDVGKAASASRWPIAAGVSGARAGAASGAASCSASSSLRPSTISSHRPLCTGDRQKKNSGACVWQIWASEIVRGSGSAPLKSIVESWSPELV
eukprot:6492532-Prymnesium_polylepis.1